MRAQEEMTAESAKVLQKYDQLNESHKNNENEGDISIKYGFLPRETPLLKLPESHKAWDEFAERLPSIIKAHQVSEELDKMPILPADNISLSKEYLGRAALILGNFAHAYIFFNKDREHAQLPAAILNPWEVICTRLGRPLTVRSMYDSSYYNWKFCDPNMSNRLDINNLDLLIPVFENEEERLSNIVVMLMEAHFASALEPIVHAQSAILNKDDQKLLDCLDKIVDIVRELTCIFHRLISPNEYSKYYIDPSTWAQTFITFVRGIYKNEPNLTASTVTLFHVLDTFIGREAYESGLGKQFKEKYDLLPKSHAEFVQSLQKVSLKNYITNTRDENLKAKYHALVDAYVGNNSLLGLHRRQAIGYSILGFRANRDETNGGIEHNATKVSNELYFGLNERHSLAKYIPLTLNKLEQNELGKDTFEIIFKSPTQENYYPGDCINVFVKNSDAATNHLLSALNATGEETIQINAAWCEALNKWPSNYYQLNDSINLIEIIRHTSLKPLSQNIITNLYDLTQRGFLKSILDNHQENDYDLTMVFSLLANEGYTIKHFLKDDYSKSKFLNNILVPLTARFYSVSKTEGDRIFCTIQRTAYDFRSKQNNSTSVSSIPGTASHYLTQKIISNQPAITPYQYVPNMINRHHLTTPAIIIAGGSGISPYVGLIEQLSNMPDKQEVHVFFSTRDQEHFYYKDLFKQLNDNIKVHVIFSQQKCTAELDHETKEFIYTQHESKDLKQFHIDCLLKDKTISQQLCKLITEKDAAIFVCGSVGFVECVRNAMSDIIGETSTKINANDYIYDLMANDRYTQEVFNSSLNNRYKLPYFNYSDILIHNNKENGYWTIIDNTVYDMTAYIPMHPGGSKIIRAFAGLDSTEYYRLVHKNGSMADSWLDNYKIGYLAQEPSDPQYLVWKNMVQKLIELDNDLQNNIDLKSHNMYLIESVYQNLLKNNLGNLIEKTICFLHKNNINAINPTVICNTAAVSTEQNYEVKIKLQNYSFFLTNAKRALQKGIQLIEGRTESTKLHDQLNLINDLFKQFLSDLMKTDHSFIVNLVHSKKKTIAEILSNSGIYRCPFSNQKIESVPVASSQQIVSSLSQAL